MMLKDTLAVPLRRSPSGHRMLNLLFLAQRAASCFSHATAGDFIEDPREQNLNVSSACMFGLSQHPFTRVCHHSNPASVTSHRSWSIPVSTQSDFAVFLMRTCASHLHFTNPGRNVEIPQISIGHELLHTKPCRGQHVLEQSYTANQHGAWISCARCALRLHYIPRHTARMTSVSTPSSVQCRRL